MANRDAVFGYGMAGKRNRARALGGRRRGSVQLSVQALKVSNYENKACPRDNAPKLEGRWG
jgi:hypothetical protein